MQAAIKEDVAESSAMDSNRSNRSRGAGPEGRDDADRSALKRVSLQEALEGLRPLVSEDRTLRFLLVSSRFLASGLEPRSLVPLLRRGSVDVVIGSPFLMDIDLGLHGPSRGRRPARTANAKSGTEAKGFLRIHDIPMERRIVHYPRHFVSLVITASKFQKVAASATISKLLGQYAKEREKTLDEPEGFLAAAYDLGIPVYIPDILNSELGRVISGQALDGNRLGYDPVLDMNEVAGFLLESRQSEAGCALVSLGGGKPLRFLVRVVEYLQETLAIREPECQSVFVMTKSGDRFLSPEKSVHLASEKGLGKVFGGFVAESTEEEATQSLLQMVESLPQRRPRNLEDLREEVWERLRKAHVEATALRNWPPLKMKFPGKG